MSVHRGLPLRGRHCTASSVGLPGRADERHWRAAHRTWRTPLAWARRCKVARAIEATLQHFGIDDDLGPFPRHLRPGVVQHADAALELGVWNFDRLPWQAWAAAPTPRAPPATWRPRTWSSCCMAWALKPALILTSSWMQAPTSATTWSRKPNSRVAVADAQQARVTDDVRARNLKGLPEGVQRVVAVAAGGRAPAWAHGACWTTLRAPAQQAADALGVARGPNCQEHHLSAQGQTTWPCSSSPRATGAWTKRRSRRMVGKIGRADAGFVRRSAQASAIGGVAPIAPCQPAGHADRPRPAAL
jgi:hypothetical protein